MQTDFGRYRQKHASGIGIAEQLELFSEPTERSTNLQSSAETTYRYSHGRISLLKNER